VLGHDDVADVVARPQHADAANEVLLLTLLEKTATGIRVAVPERREHLLQRDVIGLHPRRVHGNLILLDEAAETDDVGHSRNHLEISADDPILNASQLGRTQAVAAQPIPVDFADGRRQRRQLRLHAAG